jgi:hypothetical protein
MASMPPLKALNDTLWCGKIGASLGWEAKQGIGHEVACFWVVGAMKIGVNLAI